MPVFRVEKNKNYTTMSNYHLRDKSLSLKSKGLLSMMLSLPENWDYTIKGLAHICKDGIDSVRASVKELEAACYLTKKRIRNEKGQLTDTEYTIYEQPQLMTEEPTLDKPMFGNPIEEIPPLGNTTQLNTNIQNKEILNTDCTNQSIYQGDCEKFQNSEKPTESIDMIDTISTYRGLIHERIEYDVLCYQHDRERLDEIVEIMLECICSKSDIIRIAKESVPQELVKSRFLKINSEHIGYVMDCINANTTKIYNIKEYLKTALYNAPATISHYYTTEVNHDLYGGNRKL